ncbi:MAG TPA: hypothetical protein VFJ06_03860 [Halococcus sp.]|nr:hypothetical protein [Halococcus sp.]
MTRFDAATENARRELFADAIRAHDERDSAFLTIEVDVDNEDTEDEPVPWVQFADGTLNLDCTDDELDRLKSLLDTYSEFRIAELSRPEDAEGTNVHVSARTDPERVAGFIDRIFLDVYEHSADYRAWVVAV